MSKPWVKQAGVDTVCKDPTLGTFVAAGTTVPADAAVGYAPGCFFVQLDGSAGTYLYVNEGTRASADFNALPTPSGDYNLIDEVDLNFGTGTDVNMRWDTSDANANEFLIQLPAGTAVNVPVIVIGQSIVDVDLGLYNGVVDPRVCLMGVGAVTTGPGIDFRKARGTAAAPTVVTTGDDLGTIRAYGAVAAGEYVQAAEIRFDMAGTIATTRGPGTITFLTATDAAPSVLTTAMTISAAQLVTCAAGVTVTTGDVTVTSGNLNFTAASDINLAANTAAALGIDDGTTDILLINTQNAVKNVNGVTISSPATTIASEGAAHENPSLKLASKTITYTGGTGTTSQLGGLLNVGVLTITDSSAMTLTTASAVHINAIAAAGGMLTISNSRMISTSVSDAYLTNAGVWTDTMCWEKMKKGVERGTEKAKDMIDRVLDKLTPATWKYKDHFDATMTAEDGTQRVEQLPLNDFDRERVGIVYDDLPEELRAMGEKDGVGTGILASFALAALKVLRDENRSLEARLAKLEAV